MKDELHELMDILLRLQGEMDAAVKEAFIHGCIAGGAVDEADAEAEWMRSEIKAYLDKSKGEQ